MGDSKVLETAILATVDQNAGKDLLDGVSGRRGGKIGEDGAVGHKTEFDFAGGVEDKDGWGVFVGSPEVDPVGVRVDVFKVNTVGGEWKAEERVMQRRQ